MVRMGVVLTVALAAACARFPAAPAEGGPVWTELTSEHFTVWTDADPSRVCELIRKMERFRHLVAEVAFPTTPSSGRALAVVVRNDRELSEITSAGAGSQRPASGCAIRGAPGVSRRAHGVDCLLATASSSVASSSNIARVSACSSTSTAIATS